jgi:hypothetical protein
MRRWARPRKTVSQGSPPRWSRRDKARRPALAAASPVPPHAAGPCCETLGSARLPGMRLAGDAGLRGKALKAARLPEPKGPGPMERRSARPGAKSAARGAPSDPTSVVRPSLASSHARPAGGAGTDTRPALPSPFERAGRPHASDPNGPRERRRAPNHPSRAGEVPAPAKAGSDAQHPGCGTALAG